MRLRVLGAHNMESRHTRLSSYVVDDVLALDLGSFSRALGFEEQRRLKAVLLSHRHYDHVRDLPPLGLALQGNGDTVNVYAIQDTVDHVRASLFQGKLYPDFTSIPTPEHPTFRFHAVGLGQEFRVLDYQVTAVPVPHSVPAVGFQVSSGGRKLFYTGDAGRGLAEAWQYASPDVLLTEVTYGSENEARAIATGHMTPAFLEEALAEFRARRGYLPRVVVTHINPPWEQAVRREMEGLGRRMPVEVLVAEADMVIEI